MTEQQIIETLATKVMGWKDVIGAWNTGDDIINYGEWNPLQNTTNAWQVVEKLEDQGYGVETYSQKNVNPDRDPIRTVTLYTKEGFFGHTTGANIQEAICNAALETVA
ncbi:hypothetical protein [Brevibacillus sp. MER 51]|uniref:BC1872 family protein n=1 Tax=Brevibacillus sp. MER 51 TaxID=2939560 RepID=UPI00203CF8B4|nr:hypothetical protein [Brevibacillus sp. MER 51]MCM3144340.1 hypothetical protein [Brevibacillus sp. MER 51]